MTRQTETNPMKCGEDYLDARVASSLETVLKEAANSGVRFELREYRAA